MMQQVAVITDYIRGLLDTFVDDPADNAFQRGYQAALEELLEEIGEPDTISLDNLSS
jgi:hypothetical protein